MMIMDENEGSFFTATGDDVNKEETDMEKNSNDDAVVVEDVEEANNHDYSSLSLYPKSFYCPKTQKLMTDPVVVAEDGISYERSSSYVGLLLEATNELLYSNRAMKSIVEFTLKFHQDNPNVNLWSTTSRSSSTPDDDNNNNINKSNEIASTTTTSDDNITSSSTTYPQFQFQIPEVLFCPITFHLIHTPVIDPEGNTYERIAIENWIDKHHNSPITRTPLTKTQLRPNKTLQNLLEEESMSSSSSLFANHPLIMKWKKEIENESSTPTTAFEITNITDDICLVNDSEYTSPHHEQEAARTRKTVAFVVLFCVVAVSPYWLRNLWGGT